MEGADVHLALLNSHYDDDLATEEELLDRYSSTVSWAAAVKEAGAERVSVVQRFHRDARTEAKGVRWHFVADGLPGRLLWHHTPKHVHDTIAALRPDCVHVNGSIFPTRRLRESLPAACAVVWQHHGGPLPSGRTRMLRERASRHLDAVFFTAREQGETWKHAGFLAEDVLIREVVESSTDMAPLDRERCRMELGLDAAPLYLWIGRLDANKDPVTVLVAFDAIRRIHPAARLVMVHTDAPLLGQVRRLCSERGLTAVVTLMEDVPRARIRMLCSAADVFVLGSRSEGSGFALLEAMACGATPAVTDIPAFRAITSGGAVGRLWPPGDADACASAMLHAADAAQDRTAVRSFFEEHLAFTAVGRKARAHYEEIATLRKSQHHRPGSGKG